MALISDPNMTFQPTEPSMAEIVEAPFRAPWWLRSPHLQTLWGPLWPPV